MINFFLYLLIFIFGLIAGSFLNSIIYRLQTGESFLLKRSHCPYCKHVLSWSDLIPILSFLILKRRCRYCRRKISWQYPLVEIATGGLFVLIVNQQSTISNQPSLIIHSLFLILASCFLIIIFVYDFKHFIIPDQVIYPAIAATFIYRLIETWNLRFISDSRIWILNPETFIYPLLSALLATAFFLAIFLISRGRWLGFGDVKLVFFLGLLLGFPDTLIALFLAFLFGAIIGIGLIALEKKSLKSEVPFAPFLVIGTFIALFLGSTILNWYLSYIFY